MSSVGPFDGSGWMDPWEMDRIRPGWDSNGGNGRLRLLGGGGSLGNVLVHERHLDVLDLGVAARLHLHHDLVPVPLGGRRDRGVVHVAGDRERLEVQEHPQFRDRFGRARDGFPPSGQPRDAHEPTLELALEAGTGDVHGATRDLDGALHLRGDLREALPDRHGRVGRREAPAQGAASRVLRGIREVVRTGGRRLASEVDDARDEPVQRRRLRAGKARGEDDDRQHGQGECQGHESDADPVLPGGANRDQHAAPFGLSSHALLLVSGYVMDFLCLVHTPRGTR